LASFEGNPLNLKISNIASFLQIFILLQLEGKPLNLEKSLNKKDKYRKV